MKNSEKSLLTGLMLNPDKLVEVQNQLQVHELYNEASKILYQFMIDTKRIYGALDTTLLIEKVSESDKSQELTELIFEISEGVAVGNIDAYIKIIKEDHYKAQVKNIANKALQDIENLEDAKTTLSYMSNSIIEKQISIQKSEEKTTFKACELISGFLDRLDTGELNNALESKLEGIKAKFENGDLCIIAGRPAMGKTAFALNMATAQAKSGYGVGIYSLEMTPDQIITRIIQSEGRLERESVINKKNGSDKEIDRFGRATDKIREIGSKLRIIDIPGANINEFCSRVRVDHMQNKFDIIYIDYLQLIQGAKDNGTEYGDVTEISKKIKLLARELNIPIIALAQLNRGVEQRTNKRPSMADLRGSGQIEQDASVIQFLYRDEYYNEDSEFKGILEVITGKSRHSAIGTEYMSFYPEIQRIEARENKRLKPLKVIKKSI